MFSACVIGDHDVIFCDSEIMLSRCGRVAVLLRQLIREINLFLLSARLVIFTHFALLDSITSTTSCKERTQKESLELGGSPVLKAAVIFLYTAFALVEMSRIRDPLLRLNSAPEPR